MLARKLIVTAIIGFGVSLSVGRAAIVSIEPSARDGMRPATLLTPPPLRDGDTISAPGKDVIFASDWDDNYANDAGDAFFFTPGVFANAHDVSEPRITLRGFGLASRQERSAAEIYRDGAPLTDVHGDANIHEIDLLAVSRIDVIKGVGELRRSGHNLGGAVDFISPTGRDANMGLNARIDGGATVEQTPGGRVHGEIGGVSNGGDLDYFASVTGLYEEGFRDNNRRNSAIFNGNIGYAFNSTLKTRVFLEIVKSDSELAGGLTPDQAADDPNEPTAPITLGPLFPQGPVINFTDGARTDDFARDIFTARISNVTDFRLLGHNVETRLHYTMRDVTSPQIDFIGVIEEDGSEWGAGLVIDRPLRLGGMDFAYRAGADYTTGEKDHDRFENLNGSAGEQLFDTRRNSAKFSAFAEATFRPLRKLVADVGTKFIIVDRELTNGDDDFEEQRFTGVAARAGVTYEISKALSAYAKVARGYEPPSMGELTAADPTTLADLDEQDSFGYEAGFQGRLRDRAAWRIAYFNTDVENEIVNIDDPETNGLGDTLVNVESTTHKGIEAAVDVAILKPRAAGGRALTLRNAYTLSNHRFDIADPLDDIDGNRLAGVPQHLYRGELRYDSGDQWFAAINVTIAGGDYFVDQANLTEAPTYTVVGFSAGYKLTDQIDLFASAENITDQNYVIGTTPVLSQDDQQARLFTPATRASFYAGLRYRF
ncbi:MAG: TonB-dependent receptor [Pseudomonadota bacterium]